VDDHDLLARLRRGDEAAFDSIFRLHYAPIVGFVESMLRGRAEAEEIVQDVMLELWRRRESIAIQESLKAYLYRAARNRALNDLRHQKVKRRAEPLLVGEEAAPPVGTAELDHQELEVAVEKAMSLLTPDVRETFEMSRIHHLKYAEIADAQGISVKTVEARMGKALKTLRDQLSPWLPG